MGEPPAFRCPTCKGRFHGAALQEHLVAAPACRDALFEVAVVEAAEPTMDGPCSGALEIVPLMDDDERVRFGVRGEECSGAVLTCTCGGSFCVAHTLTCRRCGRFTCLRHRWSGQCPRCARGRTSRPIKVDKYDPFSKQTTRVIRTYRRSGPRDRWDAVEADDVAPPG